VQVRSTLLVLVLVLVLVPKRQPGLALERRQQQRDWIQPVEFPTGQTQWVPTPN
jgi:hypothetical protein